jgi:RiboL-PSP-HEPN
MQSAIDQFRLNIQAVRNIDSMYSVIKAQTTLNLDFSDILRASVVMVVSALDHYIHEITRLGMLEAYSGTRNQTRHFLNFSISLDRVIRALPNPTSTAWLEEQIRIKNSFQSFQDPDKIADAVRLFSDKQLWKEVGFIIGQPHEDLKLQLKLIIDRRNKIAHEADMDPSFPGQKWAISEIDVKNIVDFIEQLVETIHQVVV